MIFVVMLVFGVSASLQQTLDSELSYTMPLDIELVEADNVERSALEIWKDLGIDFDEYIEQKTDYRLYNLSDYTWSRFFGNTPEVKDVLGEIDYQVSFIFLSDYNRLMNLYGWEELELSENEFAVTANFGYSVSALRQLLTITNGEATIGEQKLYNTDGQVKIVSFSLYDGAANSNQGIMVFPDELDSKLPEHPLAAERVVGLYRKGVDAVAVDERVNEVEAMVEREGIEFYNTADQETAKRYYVPTPLRTRQSMIDSNIGIKVLFTFIAIYLGFVFLISAATVLALKELSNCSDNCERYMLLRKLGCSERSLRRSLFTQLALFFLLPLIIASVHAIPGFIFCDYIILVFGGINLGAALTTLALVIGVIYGGYFLITYFSAKRIIANKR